MAKGQLRSNKEAKKPKADKPKAHASAYKPSQIKSAPVGNCAGQEAVIESHAD